MIKKGLFKKAVLTLAVFAGFGASTTVFAGTSFSGEYRQGEILSFGSNLNKKEEAALREYFGVSADMPAIYVDNATAIEQLGLAPNALDNYTGGWYSSAYVKLTSGGVVQVTSKNVSLVTNEMFTNALITSGITNAEVNVSAPFMVTGESALAGILAGAEEIMGEALSEENKVVAKEEIDTTLDIADEILKDETNEINSSGDSSNVASGIINDIKQQVIKDSPNSTQIQEIIINVTNNYGVELSEEANARVLSLMEDVNDLNIDYKDIEETMNNIGDKISESLKEAGIKLKESGFFEKIGDWFVDLFKNFVNWIKGLFTGGNETAPTDAIVPETNESLETTDEVESTEETDAPQDEEVVAPESEKSETTDEAIEMPVTEENTADSEMVTEETPAEEPTSDAEATPNTESDEASELVNQATEETQTVQE